MNDIELEICKTLSVPPKWDKRMTQLEKIITLRKTIKHLYVTNASCKSIIEDLQKFIVGDPYDYFKGEEIPSYEETVKLLYDIIMKE
jgi:hypothetical protein